MAGEADLTYCSYSFFSAGHRKTGVEGCGDASAYGKSCISASSAHGLEPLFLLHPFPWKSSFCTWENNGVCGFVKK